MSSSGTININGNNKIKKIVIKDGTDFLQINEIKIITDTNKELIDSDVTYNNTKGVYTGYPLKNLFDKNTNSMFHSGSKGDTLTITLKTPNLIKSIQIFNRLDCCKDRINNYNLYLVNDLNTVTGPTSLSSVNNSNNNYTYNINYITSAFNSALSSAIPSSSSNSALTSTTSSSIPSSSFNSALTSATSSAIPSSSSNSALTSKTSSAIPSSSFNSYISSRNNSSSLSFSGAFPPPNISSYSSSNKKTSNIVDNKENKETTCKKEDSSRPDITKILFSDSTLLNVNFNYNSNNNINNNNGKDFRRNSENNLVDNIDNNYLINKNVTNIIRKVPQPLNEVRNNYRRHINTHIPCPIMINKPWSDYKSGDNEIEGFNIN